jgi:hypothetical protein
LTIFVGARPIVGIIEEHLQELAWLLELRGPALRSMDYRPRDVRLLDERVVAHLDALVLVGRDAEPLLVDALENADDAMVAAAAALALVQAEDAQIDPQPVLKRILEAPPDVARAIGAALPFARPGPALAAFEAASHRGRARVAAVAMRALASTGSVPAFVHLSDLVFAKDPVAKEAAWAAVAALSWGGRPAPSGDWDEGMLSDCRGPDGPVRDAALVAAVMTRQPFLLPLTIEKAMTGSRADLPVLALGAALAGPGEIPALVFALDRKELSLARFDIAAIAGAPQLVDPLIAAMSSTDPGIALAASAAFHRITGITVAADGVVRMPSDWRDEPEEVDEDLLEDMPRPSADSARTQWDAARGKLSSAPRLRLGLPQSDADLGVGQRADLDMSTNWHNLLRASYQGADTTGYQDFWHTLLPFG